MEEIVEIVLRAIDDASSIFSSVTSEAENMGTTVGESATEASAGFDEMDSSATEATGSIQDIIDYCQNIDGSEMRDAASGAEELSSSVDTADQSVQQLDADLGIINASMLLQTADQIGAIGSNAEAMAQDMNTAAISVGQLATQTGIAEPQMVALVNTISNATFPNDEAMMYIKSLDQMGVSSANLGASATNIDKINDAFGLGAQTTNSLAQELGVLGVDMNNVSSSFNALAYANSNTVGGMQNYYTFLRKYDAEFKELGYNVDQASIIIAAATQKYGGGRAALSGLSKAMEEANGDSRALEQALGLQAGALDNASAITGEYEGQLQALADEEAEHKTWLDQLGAAWEDFSLAMSGVLSPLGSAIGLIGQVGQFGLQVQGLQQLLTTFRGLGSAIRAFIVGEEAATVAQGMNTAAATANVAATEAEAVATASASTGFWSMAAAELAALWPLALIVAAIALVVAAVYEVGKALGWWDDFGGMVDAFYNNILVPIGEFIWSTLSPAFEYLGEIINAIAPYFQNMATAIDQFKQGNIDLLGVVISVITNIASAFATFQMMIITGLIQFAAALYSWAITAGMNFLSGIVSYLSQVPGRVATFLAQTTSRIISAGARWVAQAKAKASQLLNGVVSFLRQLPSRALSALLGVVSAIASAGAQWISNAKSKAQAVVDGAANVLKGTANAVAGALGGVANAIVKPFQDAYNTAKGIWDKIVSMASNTPSVSAAGGDYVPAAGGDVSFDNSPIEVRKEIVLDFKNVPSQVDTDMLIQGLSDRNVIRALVENRDFQSLDANMKEKINYRIARSRGI